MKQFYKEVSGEEIPTYWANLLFKRSTAITSLSSE